MSTQHTFAKEALKHGDLGVARAHAAALPDDHPARHALMNEIDQAGAYARSKSERPNALSAASPSPSPRSSQASPSPISRSPKSA